MSFKVVTVSYLLSHVCHCVFQLPVVFAIAFAMCIISIAVPDGNDFHNFGIVRFFINSIIEWLIDFPTLKPRNIKACVSKSLNSDRENIP